MQKPYGLRCLNEVMVSDSFAFRKTKSCQEHAHSVEVDAGDLIAFVSDWSRKNCELSKIMCNRILDEKLRQNRLYYSNVVIAN